MNDINKKILQAMREDQSANDTKEEQANPLQLIGRSFKGTFKFTGTFVILMQIVFAGLAIYFGYNMVYETQLDGKFNWLLAAIITFIIFVALRLWLFMELNRLSILRELKRVELQIALTSEAKEPQA